MYSAWCMSVQWNYNAALARKQSKLCSCLTHIGSSSVVGGGFRRRHWARAGAANRVFSTVSRQASHRRGCSFNLPVEKASAHTAMGTHVVEKRSKGHLKKKQDKEKKKFTNSIPHASLTREQGHLIARCRRTQQSNELTT